MSRGANIYLSTRMNKKLHPTKRHLGTFEALDMLEGIRKRKLNLKEVSTAQAYAFLDVWKEKQTKKRRRKPFLVVGSIIIAMITTVGIIKLLEWVYL